MTWIACHTHSEAVFEDILRHLVKWTKETSFTRILSLSVVEQDTGMYKLTVTYEQRKV